MHIERITRKGREFAVIPVEQLQRLMEDAAMLADVKAYDAAKARLERGEDELVPLEIPSAGLSAKTRSKYGGNTAGSPRSSLRRSPACPECSSLPLRPSARAGLWLRLGSLQRR